MSLRRYWKIPCQEDFVYQLYLNPDKIKDEERKSVLAAVWVGNIWPQIPHLKTTEQLELCAKQMWQFGIKDDSFVKDLVESEQNRKNYLENHNPSNWASYDDGFKMYVFLQTSLVDNGGCKIHVRAKC
jgi:hypothetical protein